MDLKISRIIMVIAAIGLPMICIFLTSLEVFVKTILFLFLFFLVLAVPLSVGSYFLFKYYPKSPKLMVVLGACLVGLVFGGAMFLGLLLDPRSENFSMEYHLQVSLITGAIGFFYAIAVSLLAGIISSGKKS